MKNIWIVLLIIYPTLLFGQVTDIDGNTYKTKLFGKRLWMIENLRVTRFNNGDSIPLVLDNLEWANLKSAGYCYYENKIESINLFGCLYKGYEIDTNVCPIGWRIPNEKDWEALSKEFKSIDTNNTEKILGHRRDILGQFYIVSPNNLFEGNGPWWCSSKSEGVGWNRFLDYVYFSYGKTDYRENGFPIRCVKNN